MKTNRRNLLKLLAAAPFAGVATQLFARPPEAVPAIENPPMGPSIISSSHMNDAQRYLNAHAARQFMRCADRLVLGAIYDA